MIAYKINLQSWRLIKVSKRSQNVGDLPLLIQRKFDKQSELDIDEARKADPFSPRVAQIESNYDEIVDSFDSMELKSDLLRGLRCAVKLVIFQLAEHT